MNLRTMLAGVAAEYADKTAIISGDCRLTYSELDKASNRIANKLLELGISKGDRVVMMLPNSLEFAVIFFGAVKIGAITVPLDTKYRINELASLFNDSQPRIIVAGSQVLESISAALPGFKSVEWLIEIGDEFRGESLNYEEIVTSGTDRPVEVELNPDDIAQIGYTSGPSFAPKGVMLSHRSLITEAVMSADGYKQTSRDVMMLYALPMYHVYGMVGSFLASINRGSTIVIVPGTGLSISSFFAAVEREKGTMFLGVPFIFTLAVDLAEKEGIKNDLSSLRLCASAGAVLSLDVRQRFRKQFGFELLDCWGLTEAVCHLTCPSLDGESGSTSVGKPLSGWEIKILDDSGTRLPAGSSGEIVVRGPIMAGYYNNPRATAEVVKDGWLYTGDIGRFDVEGNLYITGRKKDTIIVKGQNINPGDVESVLRRYPGVAEAVVMGIPDKLRGEIIGAFISLKPGEKVSEQELRQFCLERMIAYKTPKQMFFMDKLPKTADGRIDKEEIRSILKIPPVFPETSFH